MWARATLNQKVSIIVSILLDVNIYKVHFYIKPHAQIVEYKVCINSEVKV